MGNCLHSKFAVRREETVIRCKARKRYIKQTVKARNAFAAAHSVYLHSLRNTAAALLRFATAESNQHHNQVHHHLALPSPPPLSPISSTSTATTSSSAAAAAVPVTPPQRQHAGATTWGFWDPFMPISGRSVDEEEWEETTTTTVSEIVVQPRNVAEQPSAASTTASDELLVVSGKGKDLAEVIQELHCYFLKAADAGALLSSLLEVSKSNINRQTSYDKYCGHGKSLSPVFETWGSKTGAKWNALGRSHDDSVSGNNSYCLEANTTNATSHCSMIERLYAWEKKLYQEVKKAEYYKMELEKKTSTLRKLELKNADYFKMEKAKKEVERLESQMMVASQAIETTSNEITKLRETHLYPQLLSLVKGLTSMWRSMYEFHQVQTHIVQQLKYCLNSTVPSLEPTSEIHRQSTLQVELEAQQWHASFVNMMRSQRDYVQSLVSWLRLSLFQVGTNLPVHKTLQESNIYSLCEELHLTISNIPDKVASEGIKSFVTMIHAVVMQQADEQRQKKRSDAAFRELEKSTTELRSFESKYGPCSATEASGNKTSGNVVRTKRAKFEILKSKAQDEKAKYEKMINVTRAMTVNNLQMGLPHVFQALTGFANSCRQGFENVQNHVDRTSSSDLHGVKLILP